MINQSYKLPRGVVGILVSSFILRFVKTFKGSVLESCLSTQCVVLPQTIDKVRNVEKQCWHCRMNISNYKVHVEFNPLIIFEGTPTFPHLSMHGKTFTKMWHNSRDHADRNKIYCSNTWCSHQKMFFFIERDRWASKSENLLPFTTIRQCEGSWTSSIILNA